MMATIRATAAAMGTPIILTQDEQDFVNRMAVYVARGCSFDGAAKAVAMDDVRIAEGFGIYEGRRKSEAKRDVQGVFSGQVYRAINNGYDTLP